MYKNRLNIKLLLVAAAVLAVLLPAWTTSAAQNQPSVTRKVLMQQDLNVPGYTTALISVEIPVGGREGRHTHPGTLIVYVQEGTLTLDYEGKPTKSYSAGETFSVEPGKIHEGINKGNTPIKALASFVGEKGKPITTQVQ
jgi:quercetin dioxygenase-like cupin family protein